MTNINNFTFCDRASDQISL